MNAHPEHVRVISSREIPHFNVEQIRFSLVMMRDCILEFALVIVLTMDLAGMLVLVSALLAVH